MTRDEAMQLVETIRDGCPEQVFRDGTAGLWAGLLEELDFAEAQEVLEELLRVQDAVHPSDVHRVVRSRRSVAQFRVMFDQGAMLDQIKKKDGGN